MHFINTQNCMLSFLHNLHSHTCHIRMSIYMYHTPTPLSKYTHMQHTRTHTHTHTHTRIHKHKHSDEDTDIKALGNSTQLQQWVEDYFYRALDWVMAADDFVVDTTLVGVAMNGLSHLVGISCKSEFACALLRGLGANVGVTTREAFAKEVSDLCLLVSGEDYAYVYVLRVCCMYACTVPPPQQFVMWAPMNDNNTFHILAHCMAHYYNSCTSMKRLVLYISQSAVCS